MFCNCKKAFVLNNSSITLRNLQSGYCVNILYFNIFSQKFKFWLSMDWRLSEDLKNNKLIKPLQEFKCMNYSLYSKCGKPNLSEDNFYKLINMSIYSNDFKNDIYQIIPLIFNNVQSEIINER